MLRREVSEAQALASLEPSEYRVFDPALQAAINGQPIKIKAATDGKSSELYKQYLALAKKRGESTVLSFGT